MYLENINKNLSLGEIEPQVSFGHLRRLAQSPYVFAHDFGLSTLPQAPGIILVRGPRQYGKSTWLEQQVINTLETFGAGSAFYLNGDYLADANALSDWLIQLANAFDPHQPIKRIFIDEITAIEQWPLVLKRLVDTGVLADILVITTGSQATDLRRGTERLPGRKGRLARSDYLFTPIAYKDFHDVCAPILKHNTIKAYLLTGGSPRACIDIIEQGYIPEYLIQLVRDWVEAEITKSGRLRSTLLNLFQVLYRFGCTPVGQSKLAREANLSNNTVAQGYIELLHDLGCVIPAYPIDLAKQTLILRKPCKYHFINLLVALAYHPAQLRSIADFEQLDARQQGMWYEWLVAQELQRRRALRGEVMLDPLAFWQTQKHEIDFCEVVQQQHAQLIEIKKGNAGPIEFSWFAEQLPKHRLTVINNRCFNTKLFNGITLEQFLLSEAAQT